MRLFIIFISLLFISCSVSNGSDDEPIEESQIFIRAVDFSSLPEIEQHGAFYADSTETIKDPLIILKESGVNTIRLRLWHSPDSTFSSFNEVRSFADRVRSNDMDVWITVHYSDSWADPGQQVIPRAWQGANFETLRDSVYNYTKRIVDFIQPDIIQIGNEINSGILHPYGEITSNAQVMDSLLVSGIQAVRDNDPQAKIMLHYAGYESAEWFFGRLPSDLDYDMIGLSYYPFWHGKELRTLKSTLTNLRLQQEKDVLIAETAYPFTLGWSDFTNNTIGFHDQILDEYEPTIEGQRDFVQRIFTLTDSAGGIGVAYYGAELIAFDGPTSQSGSYWENQALFDFEFKAVPALGVFRDFE